MSTRQPWAPRAPAIDVARGWSSSTSRISMTAQRPRPSARRRRAGVTCESALYPIDHLQPRHLPEVLFVVRDDHGLQSQRMRRDHLVEPADEAPAQEPYGPARGGRG